MNQQIVRLSDPNYLAQRETSYSNDGKMLLSLMSSRGIDKEVRDQMRVYLASREAVFKKGAMHKEITRHGDPQISMIGGAETLGVYNPDTIPVDTYLKMKTDPQIAIGLAMIKMPIYSLGWTVECEDKDIKAFVREALLRVWKRLMKSMLTAIDFGFASHEMIWELTDMDVSSMTPDGRKKTHFKGKAELFKKIKGHYPSTIKIRTDTKTDDFLGIIQTAGMGGVPTKLDAPKCFMFVIGDEFGNFFGSSRLKPAYKSWYWKEVLTQFMLRYFERKGSPTTVVTHPIGGGIDLAGNTYDNSEIALRIGQNLIESGTVTLPYEADKDRGNKWAVAHLQDDKRGEMFVNALNYFGTQILRGLLTPERVMTQDLSTGSFSMASSHAEIFLLSEEGLAVEMQDSINEQLIPPLVEFNFQPNKLVPCRIHIEKIQYDRRKILKEILVTVLQNMNTFAKNGINPSVIPSVKEMSDVLGVPLAVFNEEYVEQTGLGEGDDVTSSSGEKVVAKTAKKGDNLKVVKKTPVKKGGIK